MVACGSMATFAGSHRRAVNGDHERHRASVMHLTHRWTTVAATSRAGRASASAVELEQVRCGGGAARDTVRRAPASGLAGHCHGVRSLNVRTGSFTREPTWPEGFDLSSSLLMRPGRRGSMFCIVGSGFEQRHCRPLSQNIMVPTETGGIQRTSSGNSAASICHDRLWRTISMRQQSGANQELVERGMHIGVQNEQFDLQGAKRH
jgi:hypothetical protein